MKEKCAHDTIRAASVKEKKVIRIRQYGIWICLLSRRLWKQPAYIALLLSIPLVGYAAGMMERDEKGGAVVAVCVEDSIWSEAIISGLTEREADSVLRFEFCNDSGEVKRRVAGEEADCGFILPEDIDVKVSGGKWRKSIPVYETSASSITGMAEERIASVVFRLYSEYHYAEYMEQISPSAAKFAMEAYEKHLADDSTFGFRYLFDDPDGQLNYDKNVGNDNSVNTTVFPVKGVLAVLIFVSGMCGMLEYEKDKSEKRFLRMAPKILTYMVNVWISTVFVSAAVLLCLWISEGVRSCGDFFSMGDIFSVWNARMWAEQIVHLVIYQCMILAYCVILRVLLHRQETIAVAIPILTLGSLVCSPVFIRMGSYMPVFAVLEKIFPVSYYLVL